MFSYYFLVFLLYLWVKWYPDSGRMLKGICRQLVYNKHNVEGFRISYTWLSEINDQKNRKNIRDKAELSILFWRKNKLGKSILHFVFVSVFCFTWIIFLTNYLGISSSITNCRAQRAKFSTNHQHPYGNKLFPSPCRSLPLLPHSVLGRVYTTTFQVYLWCSAN